MCIANNNTPRSPMRDEPHARTTVLHTVTGRHLLSKKSKRRTPTAIHELVDTRDDGPDYRQTYLERLLSSLDQQPNVPKY